MAIHGSFTTLDMMKETDPKLYRYLSWAKELNLSEMSLGIYPLEGTQSYINLMSYETQDFEDRVWESHLSYLDVHFMVSGLERMGIMAKDDATPVKAYDDEADFELWQGSRYNLEVLEEDKWILCRPEDVHKTGIQIDAQKPVVKAVLKIRIDELKD